MKNAPGLEQLAPNPHNPRLPWKDEQAANFRKSLAQFGDLSGIVFNERSKQLVGGHKRVEDFRADPKAIVHLETRLKKPDATGTVAFGYCTAHGTRWNYRVVDWPPEKETAANLAANQWGAEFDMTLVSELLQELPPDFDFTLTGFNVGEVFNLLNPDAEKITPEQARATLAERFGVPPFSVLDARQGYWQSRKRAWLALGIQSELGRGQNALDQSATVAGVAPEDKAAWNAARQASPRRKRRGEKATQGPETAAPITDADAVTPCQERDGFWFKRDDLFEVGGANGGKARIIARLCAGAKGLVTCGDRLSTQISRAALVAKALGIPARIHTATGPATPGMEQARAAGAELVQHKPGYLTQVKARARDDALARPGWYHVPWANAEADAVAITAEQVRDLPESIQRIVVPVGSGCTLAGVLRGLNQMHIEVPVVGVRLGADPVKRLDLLAPKDWRQRVTWEASALAFHDEAPAVFHGIELDPIYEAKCAPFLRPGDLLWIVGRRTS